MSHALRSIAFVAELIHQPIQHDPRALQKLHGELFDTTHCSYRDFRVVPGGAQMSNVIGLPGQPVSCVNLLADRVQVREEQTGSSRSDFQSRINELGETVLNYLPGQAFIAQQFTVRSIVNLHSTSDSLAFVKEGLCGFSEATMAPFPVEPSIAGLRLTFGASEELDAIFNVRVESFAQDNQSLFLETVGTYAHGLNEENFDQLVVRFDGTYGFLQDRLLAFVGQFDGEGTEL